MQAAHSRVLWTLGLVLALASGCSNPPPAQQTPTPTPVAPSSLPPPGPLPERIRAQRVLLISLDGLHEVDLERLIQRPGSTLAALSQHGLLYTQAHTPIPSDSFPGLLALITGGNPPTTGVWYDDSFDHSLRSPKTGKLGARAPFDDAISKRRDLLSGGGGIDPSQLPVNPKTGRPVYPHHYLRVNTIFEVAHAHGLRTAWSDKHLSYELVCGPSGKGVDDLFNPEIGRGVMNIPMTENYDDLKIQALIHQIGGKDHLGQGTVGVPTLFGSNLQAVSNAQKTGQDVQLNLSGGYLDGRGTPNKGLQHALEHTDASLGRLVEQLKASGLYDSTLLIITAKHGQSPMDPHQLVRVDWDLIPDLLEKFQPGLLGHAIQDTMPILWLTDRSKTAQVVELLEKAQLPGEVEEILWGPALEKRFHCSLKDPRTPDIIVVTKAPCVYVSHFPKIAEHGGLKSDDTWVGLLVSMPGLPGRTVASPVQTTQVAPSILAALGLNPGELEAVRLERTPLLPGFAAPEGKD